jgi:hypothetical protein
MFAFRYLVQSVAERAGNYFGCRVFDSIASGRESITAIRTMATLESVIAGVS